MALSKSREPYQYPATFIPVDGVIYGPHVDKELLNQIYKLPVQDGDVLVATYPKAGTTWVCEILWQICTDGEIDKRSLNIRVPFLEAYNVMKQLEMIDPSDHPTVTDWYRNQPHPRVFKVHLPYFLCPQGTHEARPKYIYIIRNPKDTAVSFYHHTRRYTDYEFDRTWDEYFEMFIEERTDYGSWFDHVLGWWKHRDDPNILFLKYEDMKKDLKGAVRKVGTFLGKKISESLIAKIANQTSFEAMKGGDQFFNHESEPWLVPGEADHIRKGIVGDWRNYFTPEQNRRFDELYAKRMKGSGLTLEL